MGMSLGSKNPIWDPIVLNGRCIGHKHIKTGIIVIDNPKLDPYVPGWEIKPPIARLYYKETGMYDNIDELVWRKLIEEATATLRFGEYIISAHAVKELGQGDPIAGKAIIDRLAGRLLADELEQARMADEATSDLPFAPLDDAKLPSWSNSATAAGVLTEETLAEALLQIRQFRGVLKPVKEGPYPPHLIAQMSDEPAPAKPFGEAVADSWRGIKDWYNGPETSQKTDPSVREHVNAEVDRQIKASEKQKPFPGILP